MCVLILLHIQGWQWWAFGCTSLQKATQTFSNRRACVAILKRIREGLVFRRALAASTVEESRGLVSYRGLEV
jgi:hypothetical protein